jgi:hypothetical protein
MFCPAQENLSPHQLALSLGWRFPVCALMRLDFSPLKNHKNASGGARNVGYTSLGFGDFTPVGPIRLLAGAEALNGLLLIGWSASFTYISMEKFWSAESRVKDARKAR